VTSTNTPASAAPIQNPLRRINRGTPRRFSRS
jgi:hypothetical protein